MCDCLFERISFLIQTPLRGFIVPLNTKSDFVGGKAPLSVLVSGFSAQYHKTVKYDPHKAECSDLLEGPAYDYWYSLSTCTFFVIVIYHRQIPHIFRLEHPAMLSPDVWPNQTMGLNNSACSSAGGWYLERQNRDQFSFNLRFGFLLLFFSSQTMPPTCM